jgi:rubrerythrin
MEEIIMADAFSKIKSSLNRGITTISVKTSSTLEKSKIRTQIETLNNEIQKLYTEIGKTSYAKWCQADPDCTVLEQLFNDIKAKEENIAALNQELVSIDERDNQTLGTKEEKPVAQFTCPNCGAGYDSPVKFCRSCGTKMGE